MALTHRLVQPLRESLRPAPARLAFTAGLRAATAIIVPMAIGFAFGRVSASWAGLAGYLVSLADPGGSYRSRALVMGGLSVAAAVAAAAATFGASLPVAAVLMFVAGFLAGFARVWGTGATTVGNSAAIIFAASLAQPGPPAAAALRAALVLAGGAWAMTLSLVLWPIRYYRPARLAVARAYRALAGYAEAAVSLARPGGGEADWPGFIAARHPALRNTLEEARRILTATRRGRAGESGRGERLLVLTASAEQAFARLVALLDVLESEREPATAEAARAMESFARTAREVAALVEREQAPATVPGVARAAADVAPPDVRDPVARAQIREVARLETQLDSFLSAAVEAAVGLHDDRVAAPAGAPAPTPPRPTPWRAAALLPVRSNLTADSLALRHALRLAVAATVAVVVARAAGLRYGYWVTLTVIIILQPYAGATVVKALQRVVGTVVGGTAAALLVTFLPFRAAALPLAAVLGWTSVVVRPINYALFAVLATPTFVLLAEARTGDWHLAGARIEDTLIGGMIALGAILLLWPTRERDRFPDALAAALRALRRHVGLAVDGLRGGPVDPARLAAVRRQVGLALINAEASTQRFVTEAAGDPGLEAALAAVTFARRLAASVTALVTMAPVSLPAGAAAAVQSLVAEQEAALEELEEALRTGRPPRADAFEPAGGGPAEAAAAVLAGTDPLLLERLAGISRQLQVLRESVVRLQAPAAERGAGAATSPRRDAASAT
ncbi:MAG TPA: FUSC family protein [Longimicrobiales bacterium]|nr:FUSC family protein [Longimicrobiales bacterium]